MTNEENDNTFLGLTYNSNTDGYYIVCEGQKSTVVGKYTPLPKTETNYESEAELESKFIKQLQGNGYEYVKIHTEEEMIKNLRVQLEKLNNYTFTDSDWGYFFKSQIANSNNGVAEKAELIHNQNAQLTFTDSKGRSVNIKLLDKKHPYKNILQVINQYEAPNGNHECRYDVTILVNGLPMVQVELKRRGVAIKEAFNQINRYKRDSFWSDSGLYEYIQLFVISNGTDTKYYSNTTRTRAIDENNKTNTQQKQQGQKTNGNFRFACHWADTKNKAINDLVDFTRTFFTKHVLLNILTKYCVFDTQQNLKVMRSYQIVATEKILNKIICSTNQKLQGTREAGGYIWHTTGSGKTLTSFKTAILASKLEDIDKVLFVVDRKDLDYQTMKEYNTFQKDSANGTRNTRELERRLNETDIDKKIIITTIQKLGIFIQKNKQHPIYNKHVVLIFDECHRGQFGEAHYAITKAFKNYHIFGFTGTPIFLDNAPAKPTATQIIEAKKKNSNAVVKIATTQEVFGSQLHSYNIVDAITDENVLPFRYHYCRTIKDIEDYNKKLLYSSHERIKEVVKYILENAYNQQTINKTFNAMFAVSSIDDAMLYYTEFQKQMAELPENQKLKLATIFSYAQNEAEPEEENNEDVSQLDKTKRDFLEDAIKDYNEIYKTNYNTGSSFQDYYKDVSKNVKDKKLDLLLVVNMFLTGFDAPCLNTLFVDKDLKHHSLLQAFSRTNRILNAVKNHGNIVSFRDIEPQVNEAMTMFGNKEGAGDVILIHTFEEYYNKGYQDNNGNEKPSYFEIVEKLKEINVDEITTPKEEKEFIKTFGEMLKARNILQQFEEFEDAEKENPSISEREIQNLQSKYVDLMEKYKTIAKNNEKQQQKEYLDLHDITFEVELLKQFDIDLEYILKLIGQYNKQADDTETIIAKLKNLLKSSIEFRNKEDLLYDFIKLIKDKEINEDNIHDEWDNFINERKNEELDKLIEDNKLNKEETYKYFSKMFESGKIKEIGTEIDKILPRVGFSANANRYKLKSDMYEKIRNFFDRFFTISSNKF
ncbi:MAG: type I restriction endonuclease subunit R [Rickettsiales bacterium]|nr:type I restriction endonuclease subunit R [Rickettsiales bacterium]